MEIIEKSFVVVDVIIQPATVSMPSIQILTEELAMKSNCRILNLPLLLLLIIIIPNLREQNEEKIRDGKSLQKLKDLTTKILSGIENFILKIYLFLLRFGHLPHGTSFWI